MCRMGRRRTPFGMSLNGMILEFDIAQVAQMMVLNASFPVQLMNCIVRQLLAWARLKVVISIVKW